MKRDNRTARYYNLRQNQGIYTGSSDLVGWWNFSENDLGKSTFVDKTGVLTGSFVGAQPSVDGGPPVKMPATSFESPSFLKGDQFLRNSSITIDSRGSAHSFEVSNFPTTVPLAASTTAPGTTLSMTFKFLQQYPQPVGAPDNKIELLGICTSTLPDGKLALWYDNDGRNNEPALLLALHPDNAGSTAATWISTTPSEPGSSTAWYDTIDDLRGWLRLDFVIYDMTYTTVGTEYSNWPNRGIGGAITNTGLKVFVNGRQVHFIQRTDVGDGLYTSSDLAKVLFGSLPAGISDPAPPSTKNSLKLGECIIFDYALSDAEIAYLYTCTRESRNSGVISPPVKTQITCAGDAYPTVNRSTDSRRLGKRTPNFDDTSALATPVVGSIINYPTLFNSGTSANGAVGSIISSPHSLPTLYVSQSIHGVQGRENVTRSYRRVKKNFSDEFSPFNDSAAPVELATRIGHLSEKVPGWSSNAGDRIVIDIDVTPTEAKVLAVVTGSNGQTFAPGNLVTPDPDKTGLAYFNFTTAKFESIGGRNSETGERILWCLPGQVSSSQQFDYLLRDYTDKQTGLESPQIMNYWEQYTGQSDTVLFYGCAFLEDFSKVPRIFQPYSSILSHRTTFNQVFAGKYNPFDFPLGRRQAYPTRKGRSRDFQHLLSTSFAPLHPDPLVPTGNGYPGPEDLNQVPTGAFYLGDFHYSADQALGSTSRFKLTPSLNGGPGFFPSRRLARAQRQSLVYGGFSPNATDKANSPHGPMQQPPGESGTPGLAQNNAGSGEWTPYSNDILGVGWNLIALRGAAPVDFIEGNIYMAGSGFSRIWNEGSPPAPWAETEGLTDEFNKTLETMGRPVAYTNWCRNSMFHASSSQGLLLSDYIDSPMVLESFDIQASVEAKRLHQPMSGTVLNTHATSEHFKSKTSREMVWWSNTNNHIDMLTFFLLKQSDSVAGYKSGAVKSSESVRELVGFSNHIFASPFVGWDWANRIHLTKDPLGLLGCDWTSQGGGIPQLEYWPANGSANYPKTSIYGVVGSNCSPMGGARATRVFKVREKDIVDNVPGVDSFTHYKNPDGTQITEDGSGGVFFSVHRGDIPNPYEADPGGENKVRTRDWFRNGVPNGPDEITANVPGQLTHQPMRRFVTASARIDVNVPVRVAGTYYQKSTPILPMCQSTTFTTGSWRGTSFAASHGNFGPYFIFDGPFTMGNHVPTAPVGRTVGNVQDRNTWVAPLTSLPTMGTFWPGGSKTSNVKVQTQLQFFSASVLGKGDGSKDDLTVPLSSISFRPSQSLNDATTIPFTYASVAPQLADIWSPSPRLLINHSGSTVNFLEQIGGRNKLPLRSTNPGIERSYNPSFDNPPGSTERKNFPGKIEYPGYLQNDFEKSDHPQNVGYILEPKDRLIFGTQWSPADAVHRSMQSIRNAAQKLKFIGSKHDPTLGAKNVVTAWSQTGSIPGPRQTDASWVFNRKLRDSCLTEISAKGQLSPEVMGSQYYRWAGFCETNDLAMMASASCEILAEPMRLRLYGTLIREQRQQQHSLPQQLTTNCVHEVIGNEPVIDQYSLAERSDYQTNSSLATQITGSLNLEGYVSVPSNKKTFTGTGTTSWGTESDQINVLARGKRRTTLSGGTFRDVFAIKRSLRLSDLSEFYYDSLTPDLQQCFAADGCGFNYDLNAVNMSVATNAFGTNQSVSIGVGGVISYGTADGATWRASGEKSNRVWGKSFPFEPKYSGIQRLFNQNVRPAGAHFLQSELPLVYSASFTTSTFNALIGFGSAATTDLVSVEPGGVPFPGPALSTAGASLGGIFPIAPETVLRAGTATLISDLGGPRGRADFPRTLNPKTAGNVAAARTYIYGNFAVSSSIKSRLDGYFGIGTTGTETLAHYGSIYLESTYGTTMKLHQCALLAQKPRGYKYGLISSAPKTLSAVYRNNRYGQFRDMLEQRKFSALFINDPVDVANSRRQSGNIARQSVVEEPAVTARFRSPAFQNPTAPAQNVQVQPVDTNCSNLNNAMTSSLPYFDGVLRNRDSAPTTDTDVIVI